jgi:iron complex outermembrane receptor protein
MAWITLHILLLAATPRAALCSQTPTQTPTISPGAASLSGIVTDESGAVVPGVVLTLTDIDSGVQQRVTSDAQGTYLFDFVAAGSFTLTGAREGFAPVRMAGLVLRANDRRSLALQLKVAGLTEGVAVVARRTVPTRSASATKTDTPLIETPQSISVVSRELMDARGVTTLNEALGYTAGVKAETYGADPRYDWASLRGFDAYSPGYFRDGLHARNNGSWFTWRMDPYGLDRVEVMRGPASVLYGQNTPGGIVNVTSKRPIDEKFGELQLQAGTFGRLQGSLDVGGRIDTDGKLLYRVTGLARDSDYQVDFVPDDKVFLAPALTWRPSARTRVTVLSHFQDVHTGSGINFLPAEGTLLPNPNGRIPLRRFTGELSFEGYEQTDWAVGSFLDHRASESWSFSQNVRYGSGDLDYKQVYGTGLDASDPSGRTLARGAFSSREQVSAFTIDHQARAILHTGRIQHTALVGVDYQRHGFDQRSAYGSAPSLDVFSPVYGQPIDEPSPYVVADATLTQAGLYFQDQMKVDQWVVVLGGRYDHAGTDVDDHLTAERLEQDDDQFTSRAGLVYLAPSGFAPYVSYSESFFPVAGTDPESGQPFKPETGRQYEAGLKYQPAGWNSFLSLAAFDLRRQNYLTTDPATFLSRQTGEIRSRGLELEAATTLSEGVSLTVAYTWLRDFEIVQSSDPSELGKRQPNVPAHTASLWVHHRFREGALAGVGLGGGARYVGSTFGDLANSSEMSVPGFTLFDAALSYEAHVWRLALNVRNLADKTYVSCWSTCYYGSSRSTNATLSYRW